MNARLQSENMQAAEQTQAENGLSLCQCDQSKTGTQSHGITLGCSPEIWQSYLAWLEEWTGTHFAPEGSKIKMLSGNWRGIEKLDLKVQNT